MNPSNVQQQDSRNIVTSENKDESVAERILKIVSWILVIIFIPISWLICIRVLNEFERAVIFRLGRLRKGRPSGPGLIWILPCIDEFIRVDLRTASFDVPPQEILTKDSVTIKVDAVVYYRLGDPLKAIIQIENVNQATKLLAQTTLRNVTGTKMLTELLSEKDALSLAIGQILDEATDPWGVKVERVEIKEIYLPKDLQRAMAVEQEAIREAKAKIAAADGELKASQALKDACDVMSSNPISFQLRYLQTLNTISNQQNHTVIFPFPVDLIRKLMSSGKGQSGAPANMKPEKCECPPPKSPPPVVPTTQPVADTLQLKKNEAKTKTSAAVQVDLSLEDLIATAQIVYEPK